MTNRSPNINELIESMTVVPNHQMRRQRIDVNTRNLADLDSPPKVRRSDWTHEGRDWLIGHLTWALRSGHSVTLSPAVD